MASNVEVGILVKGAGTTADVARALRAMANTIDKKGLPALTGEWEVETMVIITRTR